MLTATHTIISLLLQTLDGLRTALRMREDMCVMASNDPKDIDRASDAIEAVEKRATEDRLRFRLAHYSACHVG